MQNKPCAARNLQKTHMLEPGRKQTQTYSCMHCIYCTTCMHPSDSGTFGTYTFCGLLEELLQATGYSEDSVDDRSRHCMSMCNYRQKWKRTCIPLEIDSIQLHLSNVIDQPNTVWYMWYICTYTTPVWTRCARPLGQPLEPSTPENVLWVIEQYLSIYIHESKQSSKYISKKQCEWKATHEAANGPCDLCLNALVHTCTLRSTQASCQWRGLAGHHEFEQGYPCNCAWVVCWFSFWQVFTSIDAAAGQWDVQGHLPQLLEAQPVALSAVAWVVWVGSGLCTWQWTAAGVQH